MYSDILNVLGTTRSSSILNLFLDALTRGGPSGLPRPIELHAHDPIRYVGDILAWIHQTMAGEREFLESLFGIKEDGRWVGSVRALKGSEDAGEDELRLRKLLDKDLEGCGRPLKVPFFQLFLEESWLTSRPRADPGAADDQESRGEYHGVPDRNPHSLL